MMRPFVVGVFASIWYFLLSRFGFRFASPKNSHFFFSSRICCFSGIATIHSAVNVGCVALPPHQVNDRHNMQLRWCTSWSSNQYIELYGVHEMCCLFVRLLEERKEDGRDLVSECSAHIGRFRDATLRSTFPHYAALHDPTDRSRQRSGNAITRMNGTRKKAHKQQIFCSVAALNISKTINKSVIATSNVVWKKRLHFHLILSNIFCRFEPIWQRTSRTREILLMALIILYNIKPALGKQNMWTAFFHSHRMPFYIVTIYDFLLQKMPLSQTYHTYTFRFVPLENMLSERCSHCITFDWNHIYLAVARPVHILW